MIGAVDEPEVEETVAPVKEASAEVKAAPTRDVTLPSTTSVSTKACC
jgi:hypothetical protein